MLFMYIVIIYLYGYIENDIYMKVLEGFRLFETSITNPYNMHNPSIDIRVINRFSEYTLTKGSVKSICPYILVKK